MNWTKIKKEYPKALNKLIDYIRGDSQNLLNLYADPQNVGDILNPRELYDFFDKQGIHIEILVDRTMEAKFCYNISQENEFEWNTTGYSDLEYTRPKAEQAAFLKAFEILEGMLK